MLRLLLLGGTREARLLAEQLQQAEVDFIYSLAGVTPASPLTFKLRRGGFGGVEAMAAWLRREHIGLVVDVSHPYAAGISANAVAAGRLAGVPVWGWQRQTWQAEAGDNWLPVADWAEAASKLQGYQRPLITLGSSLLRRPLSVPSGARWLLRCMPGWHGPLPPRVRLIRQPGALSLQQERELLHNEEIDVLVSRNSGGEQRAAKLQAARERRIPVLMLRRPPIAQQQQRFSDVDHLIASIITFI